MPDLSTTYIGLQLNNPIVAASSPLTSSVSKVQACEQAGIGAVVLKSLFEEQINADVSGMAEGMETAAYSEAYDYIHGSGENIYVDKYLELIEESKKKVKIPVIASLNCISAGNWIEYAQRIENVGADGLELNVFLMPANVKTSGRDIEKTYLEILRKIKAKTSIPVALKIGPHFSGLAEMIKSFAGSGADAVVLFNRFYRPDVNISSMNLKAGSIISSPEEMGLSLQWISLLSGEIDADFAATTGIHDGPSVVKQLLVGAKTVQLCSTLIKNGLGHVQVMLSFVEAWMDEHGYATVDEFRGKLCQEKSENPEAYERAQYVKAHVGIS